MKLKLLQLAKFLWLTTLLLLLTTSNLLAQQPQQTEKFVYTLPATERVAAQQNIEYNKAADKSLRFDFYRLPATEKTGALPVVIIMNGFGNPGMKETIFHREWAKLSAAVGFAAIAFESRPTSGMTGGPEALIAQAGEDLDALVAHLRANKDKLGIDPENIIIHASSGNAAIGFPVVMDKKRTFIKGAVMYYGAREVKEFRPDLPTLFVRVGLDVPALNRDLDKIFAKALSVSAPVELISYPGGHHPFETVDDNDASREVIAQTLAFMQKAASKGVQSAMLAASDEAAAGAALMMENWSAAVAGYSALAAKRPQDNEVHRRFGDALFGAKEYARATQAYDQALKLGNWRRRDISYPAAVACARLGDVEGALKWINILVKTPFNRASLLTDQNFEALRTNAQFRALAEGRTD